MELVFAQPPNNPQFIDKTGNTYHRLTVLGFAGKPLAYKGTLWWCRCICGTTIKTTGSNLTQGTTKSCGCYRDETRRRSVHGMRATPEFNSYCDAKKRCTNKNAARFADYGGRGIEFRFSSFLEFIGHVGKKPTPQHSLDRIDVNGHYEMGNVRWATPQEQSRNRRQHHYMTVNGETRILTEWSEQYSIPPQTIRRRLRRGFCDTCAVTLPSLRKCPHTTIPSVEHLQYPQ